MNEGVGLLLSNDLRLTVAEIIKRPLFQHAQIVAGHRGLSRPIRWVHVLETADTGQFLNGGELILSTGLGFGEDKETRLAYLTELIRRKAVGLCIELGRYIPSIPDDMLELANHHQFPLLVFHKPVRFVDITQDLHEHLIHAQMQALRNLEAYSRSLQQLSLQAAGIPKLLQHFQIAVQTQVFYYSPDGPVQFAPVVPHDVAVEMGDLMRAHFSEIDSSDNVGVRFLSLSATRQLVYQPVMAMGHLLAYVGIVLYERSTDEYLLLTLDNTVSAMAQILMRKIFVEEQALATENRLFDDLIANRSIPEDKMRTLLGITGAGKSPIFHTVIVSFEKSKSMTEASLPPHDLTAIFRSLLTRHSFRPFIRCLGNRFYFLLIEQKSMTDPRRSLEKAFHDIKRILTQMLGPDIHIWLGISRPGKRLSDAGGHLAEAEQALAFSQESSSPFFADLGLYRLLFHIPSEPVLRTFIADYLGPLLAYDKTHGSALVNTLRAYLDANLSKQEAAEKLFIHRQTLYHRLEKIEECLGEDFATTQNRICLEIALRAQDWLSREEHNKKDTASLHR